MTTIDIYSGFLGAGKTTLIKKMIKEAYAGEQIVLIENEFGEIGIDGGFMKDAGIRVNEMTSGCICCSLVGDFGRALVQVMNEYHPDRILIEPSGVGKLSDVIGAVKKANLQDACPGAFVAVADAAKCKIYMKNFGEFYANQIEAASTIILSRTSDISPEKLDNAISLLREHNKDAVIITTPWDQLTGRQLLDTFKQQNSLTEELSHMLEQAHHHEDECSCHEDHYHEDECSCHGEHHHHHHADEIFSSWGVETPRKFTREEIKKILSALDRQDTCGLVLRAKGIVPTEDGSWLHFDHVPGEIDVREGCSAVTGRLCVIGSGLNESAIAELFGV